ncbi:MAG: response regulator transcription factor [Nevskia sp.]|nr:response regulator transcription factor [Nevskia sp.]
MKQMHCRLRRLSKVADLRAISTECSRHLSKLFNAMNIPGVFRIDRHRRDAALQHNWLGPFINRALGLELGASDYLGKPFLPAELLARIRTQLRGPRMTPPKPIEVGELRLYPAQRRACIADRDLSLTAAEFSLLLALARTPRAVVCRNELTQAALGRQHEMYERCIDVHISRVRRKLAEASPTAPRIISIRGNGYLLQSCDTTDLACLILTAHHA